MDSRGSTSRQHVAAGRWTAVKEHTLLHLLLGLLALGASASDIQASAPTRALAVRRTCNVCPAGRFGCACKECPRGRANPLKDVVDLEECEECDWGSISDRGAARCYTCPVGTYAASPSACKTCEAGRFGAAEGATACEECGAGKYRLADSQNFCASCPAGRYGPSTMATRVEDCRPCPAGTYSWIGGGASIDRCLPCRAGTSSSAGASVCQPCQLGTFNVRPLITCARCPAGRFVYDEGATECNECPPGAYREDVSTVSCLMCSAGTFSRAHGASSASTCVACGRGTYGLSVGATSCTACEQGSYNDQQGLSACLPCPGKRGSMPTGAVACCPQHNDEVWPISPAGTLYTAPGKSETQVFLMESCYSTALEAKEMLLPTGEYNANVAKITQSVFLATMRGDDVHKCLELSCGYRYCHVSVETDDFTFRAGDKLRAVASIVTYTMDRYSMERCDNSVATVMVAGAGCSKGTMRAFVIVLIGVVAVTAFMGVVLEMVERRRLNIFVESNLDITIPRDAAATLPTKAMVRESIVAGLGFSANNVLPRRHFSAWMVPDTGRSNHTLHIEFGIHAPPGGHRAVRRQLLHTSWAPSKYAALWANAKVEQQSPTLVKAAGRLPGLEFVALLEWCVAAIGGVEDDDGDAQELHLSVAREVLSRLTSRSARVFLALQYFLNIAVAGFLAGYAYFEMGTCSDGYPIKVHAIWGGYIGLSCAGSLLLLRLIGGPRAGKFLWRFRKRLLIRFVFMCIMLTDTYQDTTFPVIAKKCGFDLWFVSAWLVFLGVFVMQFCAQLLALLFCVYRYRHVRTPEERERLIVEGAFLALRGSDNLMLVFAVRPAVEERLGGASSWAMKLTEARITFIRFLFEDVEQSALQVVFLLFYEDAAMAVKVWVSLSIATALLVSFTLVVQCLPEVRDWLWYRVLSPLPGCRWIPICRILWLLIGLALYRLISVFPWISACSPTGDPCEDGGVRWWFTECNDGETTLFGLAARSEAIEEVGVAHFFSSAGLGSTFVVMTIFWWIQSFANRRGGRWKDFKAYSAERRFAAAGQELRPLKEEDDDHWLEPARRIYTATRNAHAAGTEVSCLERLVQAIDKDAYECSRAPLPKRLPFFCRVGRKLTRRIDALGHSAQLDKIGGGALGAASQLCAEATHSQQVASVRWNATRLLSSRKFRRASLELKARYIAEATGNHALLRFIHWSVIDSLGELPKFGQDFSAEQVPDVLTRVATNLGIKEECAECHLVTFFLSHRWLRVRGPKAVHHPDAEDHVKATQLAAFARWYMSVAAAAGLRCEVVFWIDWCCCEQDHPAKMDIGIAALPLFIASCTKVVVWRTPDFDRRCWTMVERLLSYTFCSGGLTPYVIDETSFAAAIDDASATQKEGGMASSRHSGLSSGAHTPEDRGTGTRYGCARTALSAPAVWQVWVDGRWINYSDVQQGTLRWAKARGDAFVKLRIKNTDYVVDLRQLVQRNHVTGFERNVRETLVQNSGADVSGRPNQAQGCESRSSSSGTATSASSALPRPGAAGIMVGESSLAKVARVAVHRRARKLPNPLDFETCAVTRASDRRRVAQLVDVALVVPGLEAFADRQPVEWGLTEVVEQSLVAREALPDKWAVKDVEPPALWLEPVASTRGDWKLVVDRVDDSGRRVSRLDDHTDAIVWVDHTPKSLASAPMTHAAAPPSPAEISRLFSVVDATAADRGHVAASSGAEGDAALDDAVRALVGGLKSDLQAALQAGDEAGMEAALVRARDVTLFEKHEVAESVCDLRLQAALATCNEAAMRGALRMVRAYGADHIPMYEVVAAEQRRLYEEGLFARLQAQLEATSDVAGLAAVHYTAKKYSLASIAEDALSMGICQADHHRQDRDLEALESLQAAAKDSDWRELVDYVARAIEETTMAKALDAAYAEDNISAIRAVEQRARGSGREELAALASDLAREAASRVGERMGLPVEWDVVLELAGAPGAGDNARLLKKSEETERALVERMQLLVDATHTGWGPAGKLTRTRDRGKERIPSRLEIKSVVYVQNAENYVNYSARRTQIQAEVHPEARRDWDVKTALVSLAGVGRHKTNPVDTTINEHYLWHGTTPAGAHGITDTEFDIKRAGTVYGALFGPGIYFAESCMKADEYTKPDERGWFPLILCRVVLGHVNYCDVPEPKPISRELEASCQVGAPFHSVLGDREKVRGTFREFIVFDNHQVYPEYIVWYTRKYDRD